MPNLDEKYAALKAALARYGKLGVAFSGGVDSTLLLKAAHDALGDNAVALTAHLSAVPEFERREAAEFCASEGIRQIVCELDALSVPAFAANAPDRCYHCKIAVLSALKASAAELGVTTIAEGTNLDDLGDYRPGRRAVLELGVISPLLDAGLTKAEIRALSARLDLPTWDKPAYACLASRIPTGEAITEEKLRRVELAEAFLMEKGFRKLRVRAHGELARIEVAPEDIEALAHTELREAITGRLRALGFRFVALDLTGYKTGSMNPDDT